MAEITREGTNIKINDGIEIQYYLLSDIRVRVEGNTLEIRHKDKIVHTYVYTDIVLPEGDTLEEIADKIANFTQELDDTERWLKATDQNTRVLAQILKEQETTNKYLRKIYNPK